MPATFNVCPWALLMDMAKLSLTGNCIRLNVDARSLGMTGIRGMNTSSPLAHPVMTVASRRFGMRLFTRSLVPLHSLGASRFRSSMMGAPTFRSRLWGGVPGGSRELRNSAGKSTSWLSPQALSMDLYEDALPGSCLSSCKLMFVATSFFGASIARSHIHCGYSTSPNRLARFGKTLAFSWSVVFTTSANEVGMDMRPSFAGV